MLNLEKKLEKTGLQVSPKMCSIILVGGNGTRLKDERKTIDVDKYSGMDRHFHGMTGPKGLALLKPENSDARSLTDWHLEIHRSCKEIEDVHLALGCGADMMENYYQARYQMNYKGLNLHVLPEKNPAGTLAPLIKLYSERKLTDGVYIYANGDNLADIDFLNCYRLGVKAALDSQLDMQSFVIDVAALVPWEESAAYGTLNMDFETGKVHSFKEKGPVEENSYIEISGERFLPINSGFSIIVNPLELFDKYLDKSVIETSQALESGQLDYKGNEKTVKYETFYEQLASEGKMVAVLHEGYWTDLGTEEKLLAAEQELPYFFKK